MVTNFEASQAPGATVGRPNSSHPTESISRTVHPKITVRRERGYNAEMPTPSASGDFGVSREYRRLDQIAEKCILLFSARERRTDLIPLGGSLGGVLVRCCCRRSDSC